MEAKCNSGYEQPEVVSLKCDLFWIRPRTMPGEKSLTNPMGGDLKGKKVERKDNQVF